jgi:ribosome-associated protein
MPKTDELTHFVKDVLDDIKAHNIVTLDVSDLTTVTDYMMICSGNSDRHVRAIADNLVQKAKQHGCFKVNVEGQQSSDWILVDLGDVIVHIMQPSIRDFYNLEKLWAMPIVNEMKA